MVNEQLLEYVKEQVKSGVSKDSIKATLLSNDWSGEDVEEAFSNINTPENAVVAENQGSSNNISVAEQNNSQSTKITMDKIIEKIIPIIGALFLVIGLGYLIYANAWVHLSIQIRITFGFFASMVLIGGSFSFPDKMRYFADIGIGSGVLLLYGTLIYGSRTTELADAVIPEVTTLFTAAVFTVLVSYFASKRNSKVILILGMIGAYLTPFVIGQNDVWAHGVSFNAYLAYFLAINVAVFFMGREISVRDIIPLNIIGLFVGVSTLWGLASSAEIDTVYVENFFTSEIVTAVLFMVLVIFSMWSILLSAKRFNESDDGYLSLGYLAPIIWFFFNLENLSGVTDMEAGVLYAIIAISCFAGWHVLQGTKTRFQHTALYAAGLLSAIVAFFTIFQELNVYTSMFIAYVSLIFAGLYLFDSEKSERFISYAVVSLMGSILSLHHIIKADLPFETVYIVVALLPAMSAYAIAKYGSKQEFLPFAKIYSFTGLVIALSFVLGEIIEYIDVNFVLFYIAPLAILGYLAFQHAYAKEGMSHESKSSVLRYVLAWFALGFFGIFIHLVVSIYPSPTDLYLFTHLDEPLDWGLVKGVFGTIILFVGLHISRKLQLEQVIKRPSFILVIFGFSTLLLTGNYIISAIANDLQVSMAHGGPRAIATTIWWALLAMYMLYVGIKFGKKYHAEKLLGLILVALMVGKVILYDIATMDMQNKIIVLMIVGGVMLTFSYVVRSKNMLELSPTDDDGGAQ